MIEKSWGVGLIIIFNLNCDINYLLMIFKVYELHIPLLAVETTELFKFVPVDISQLFKICKIELRIVHELILSYIYN